MTKTAVFRRFGADGKIFPVLNVNEAHAPYDI